MISEFDISKLEDFIDWTPFFKSWDLHGKYPNILTDEVVGEQAKVLFEDAQFLLNRVFKEKLLQAKAVFGLFTANSKNDDDIEFFYGEEDWVLFVDEDAGQKCVDKNKSIHKNKSQYYKVAGADHNIHMDNPNELGLLILQDLS